MNCPHGWTKIDPGTECGACWRERTALENARAMVAAQPCPHGAEGYLFKLDPAVHAGATGLEWCPGCGAHRLLGPGRSVRNMRELGAWILPGGRK
jgi:hypothetical protein